MKVKPSKTSALSRFLTESNISRINRSVGVRSEKTSYKTYEILSRAIECLLVEAVQRLWQV
jgi:histone H3/H4